MSQTENRKRRRSRLSPPSRAAGAASKVCSSSLWSRSTMDRGNVNKILTNKSSQLKETSGLRVSSETPHCPSSTSPPVRVNYNRNKTSWTILTSRAIMQRNIRFQIIIRVKNKLKWHKIGVHYRRLRGTSRLLICKRGGCRMWSHLALGWRMSLWTETVHSSHCIDRCTRPQPKTFRGKFPRSLFQRTNQTSF